MTFTCLSNRWHGHPAHAFSGEFTDRKLMPLNESPAAKNFCGIKSELAGKWVVG